MISSVYFSFFILTKLYHISLSNKKDFDIKFHILPLN
nr:MAG TPA: hypothetical protein [Caudoviricetes sp.]